MSTSTTNTRQLVYIASLSAVSFLLMYVQFPLIPSANFLQFEFSILPALVALLIFDLKSAFAVLTLRTLLKLILNNGGVWRCGHPNWTSHELYRPELIYPSSGFGTEEKANAQVLYHRV